MRFEDLINDAYPELVDVFRFLFQEESLEGTNLERRIKQQASKGSSGAQVYTLKSSTQTPNKNLHRFEPEVLAKI